MNLANQLTLVRIILVPLFMTFLLVRIPYGQFIAAGIFILAASTDGLDGYIARSRQQITNLGKIMDPLADKLLISSALISLVELDLVRAWVAFVIIAREFAVTGLRAVAAAEGFVIAASPLGKVKTVSQIVAVVVLLIRGLPIPYLELLGQVSLYFAVVVTILSGIDYFYKSKGLLEIQEK
ncbi:CDP-diacylglycerol--glycerol-3-phosphate 3-phosphatidyltransferase [Zhaonella formicivorans]|uniref:CDP-diacylglycerol--glycerol-3-phosphate 3-phosphatidyltransferase n=1 Tax=Zhaonella formicivorans TaxID=2528593 RepID=UPI0010EC78A9|nr:CDP-diacylglycerol--glycerol-3-phosphate 3-phosphatidyltransferase [Zhaonella formicivorans]